MPQNKSRPPTGRMTWGRAIPVLVICVIFDAVRFMFEWFIFFGPALAAVGCTAGLNSVFGTTLAGAAGKMVAGACATGAGALGFFGSGAIGAFGIVMAMTVGFLGWGTVTLILAITNPRIWKSNVWGWIWSICALGVSEAPLLGTIPMLTITHIRLYAGQIKKDKAALKQYQQEQEQVAAAARSAQQLRQQRLFAQMQARAADENEEIPEGEETPA